MENEGGAAACVMPVVMVVGRRQLGKLVKLMSRTSIVCICIRIRVHMLMMMMVRVISMM